MSDVFIAVPIAVVLGTVFGLIAYFAPNMFGSSKKLPAPLPTGAISSAAAASAHPSGSASPTQSAKASKESDACTFEVLAGMDAQLHNASTTAAFPDDSAIGTMAASLRKQFERLLATEDGQSAVSDTIGLARQLCASAGNPMLTLEGVKELMAVATETDVKLLLGVRAFGLIGPGIPVVSPSASN